MIHSFYGLTQDAFAVKYTFGRFPLTQNAVPPCHVDINATLPINLVVFLETYVVYPSILYPAYYLPVDLDQFPNSGRTPTPL